MSIPKIIHYCWFGGKKKPNSVKKYIETWSCLKDYKVIEWNETNFDINSSEFVKFAYENKKWAFVSDYVRLKVLNECGGIYLDTDVEVKKSLDDILDNKMFLSFIYDSSIGTAVIGAVPQNRILQDLIGLYDNCEYSFIDNKIKLKIDGYEGCSINNNNDLFTAYFIRHVEGFKLVNKNQYLNDVTVFKKEYFERKTFDKNIDYCVHHCYGSWYKDDPDKRSKLAIIINSIVGDVFYDKLQCAVKNKRLPYYNIHLDHKKKIT